MTDDLTLSLEQEQAIELCVGSDAIVGVTGRAGTGKTTILRHAYTELRAKKKVVALVAPTGRAARRITEATGVTAKTIHRLLEFPKPDDDDVEIVGVGTSYGPRRNRARPLIEDVIIVDEASMIGPILYKQLVDALKPGARLLVFGDNKQLPPVETGEPPFRQLLQDKPSVELSYNYRSDDEIIGNADLILHGRVPQRNSRFEVIYSEEPVITALKFVDETFASPENQIIMPMRKGEYGTMRLNPSLQIRLNRKFEDVRIKLDRLSEDEKPITLRAHDKFLWIKNDYNFNLFNGDIGIVEGIDMDSGEVGLSFANQSETIILPPSKRVSGPYGAYQYDPRKQIEVGYAVTTHKAQGSEFHTVLYVMSSKGQGGAWMCSRNNFYTGVTRARQRVIVIADRNAMHLSLRKVV